MTSSRTGAPEIREFPLGDILSVTTGRLVSRKHIGGIYEVLNFMTGASLLTHQLPRAAKSCGPELLRQLPQLVEVEVPEGLRGEEAIFAWLDNVKAKYGAKHPVTALAPGYQFKNPFTEWDDLTGGKPIAAMVVTSEPPSEG